MNAVLVSAGISGLGLVLSVLASAFIAGTRWGSVKAKLDSLERGQADRATKDDLHSVTERLAKIEGMFELRLKGQDGSQ